MGFIISKVEYPSHPLIWGRKGKILSKIKLVRRPHLILDAQKCDIR